MADNKDKKQKNTSDIVGDSSPLIGADPKKKHVSQPIIVDPNLNPDGTVQLNEHGMPKFAKKEKEEKIDPVIESQVRVTIPPIYYWEDVHNGKSFLMTMAFKWKGQNWGESYPIEDEDDDAIISKHRQMLFGRVKETLDVLLHHGTKVLDSHGNIDPRLVNDEEAIRWKHDPHWQQKVAAFNKLVRIAPITRDRAVQLKLVDALVL